MLTINTNLSSLIAQSSMKQSTAKLNQAIERMTTGFKINHAKDNAANYSIATNMTTKINSYMVAEDNAAMGLDIISTAEGTLNQIQDKLERLRALQEQASNGTYGEQSLNAINAEANALVDEINRLYSTAEYNGMKLFESEATPALAGYAAPRVATKKFIDDVTTRDTSSMKKLSTVNESQTLASGTYSISTVEELEKLARLANTGKLYDSTNDVAYGNYEFVLANDIDLSGYGNWIPIGNIDVDGEINFFTGIFDGNGYSINNLTIKNLSFDSSSMEGAVAALFGFGNNATIKNLGVENVNIENSGVYTAAIVGMLQGGSIQNCFSTGFIETKAYGGGLMSYGAPATISDSYSLVTISGSCDPEAGGGTFLGGGLAYAGDITNSFFGGEFTINFTDTSKFGVPIVAGGNFSNSYAVDTWTTPENIVISEQCCDDIGSQIPPIKTASEIQTIFGIDIESVLASTGGTTDSSLGSGYKVIDLQIGINCTDASKVEFDISFNLAGVNNLRMIGLDVATDYLTQIDDMLALVSEKQTHFGAVSNRLESVLEEITIQRDNLISSRSTIRDADIAEVSSHYIQQQILQQASATLLATANQSPSIALQLI